MRHNTEESYVHYSVFHKEVLEEVARLKDVGDRIFVDCTLGEGGHSELILSTIPDIKVIAFERDPEILAVAKKRLEKFGERISFINDNFSQMESYFDGYEDKISAILYDFGISSYHFDVADRGFTFQEEQKLDMRLDPNCPKSAYDIVNGYSEKMLADIFFKYGEERFGWRIARAICDERASYPIETAAQLADIVKGAVPRPKNKKHDQSSIHPATRVFQALRIEVNGELDAIEKSLSVSWKYLAKGGRILAISFHSLEDRIAKNIFRSLEKGCYCTEDTPICTCDRISRVKVIAKKPILPSDEELSENTRSRSAKLRICERV